MSSKFQKELYMVLSPEFKHLIDNISPEDAEEILNSDWAKEVGNRVLKSSKEEMESALGIPMTDEDFAGMKRRIIWRINNESSN